jgi:outer membrane receptor for ferrienterochelin and colicin
MKSFCSFKCVFFIFVLVFFASVLSAQELSEKTDKALEEEFKWLKAEADAVTVTVATKTQMSEKEAPSTVSVITEEEIRNMGARTIVDVLTHF